MINSEKNRINKVLSNTEIQSIITAIGTGIGDEFDLAKLRYHRIIVMTDADVDGSHIRTLILTFLYRQMKDLVEGGYVYIAVPPLYRVKVGGREQYVEKESLFEEFLVRERVKDIEVHDRRRDDQADRDPVQPLHSGANEFEGWSARLRADFGQPAADLVIAHRLVETEASRPPDVGAALAELAPNGYELTVVEADDDRFRVKIVERETGAARARLRAGGALSLAGLRERPPGAREAVEVVGLAAVRDCARKEARGRAHVRGAADRASSWRRRGSRSAASRVWAR